MIRELGGHADSVTCQLGTIAEAIGITFFPSHSPRNLSWALFIKCYIQSASSKETIMSRASKTTLGLTTLATAGIVYFVHWAQEADRAVCGNPNHKQLQRLSVIHFEFL